MTSTLRTTTAADSTSATTTILVDGVDLLELQPRLRRLDGTVRPGPPGLFRPADPVGLLPPDSRVLLPGSESSGAMVGICSCGEPGDSSLWLQVRGRGRHQTCCPRTELGRTLAVVNTPSPTPTRPS